MKDTTNSYEEGSIVVHKATLEKCVVIETVDNKVKVRTEKNIIEEYFPQELELQSAREERQKNQIEQATRERNWKIGSRYGL